MTRVSIPKRHKFGFIRPYHLSWKARWCQSLALAKFTYISSSACFCSHKKSIILADTIDYKVEVEKYLTYQSIYQKILYFMVDASSHKTLKIIEITLNLIFTP
jgi:hypothetical protein